MRRQLYILTLLCLATLTAGAQALEDTLELREISVTAYRRPPEIIAPQRLGG